MLLAAYKPTNALGVDVFLPIAVGVLLSGDLIFEP